VYEKLGVGGMAQVHRAIAANSDVQRPVALKRMLSHIAGSEAMVKSFVREARLASYLRHENVAQTYDLGRVGDTYFIVMELITGRTLRAVLRHCGSTTGPMPVPIALNILNQICDALDYAHNLCDETGQPLGIIHRDVSPSNIIVSDAGVVKLIDFGIAKASGAGMQTMSGALKGKFAYMAPEYLAGRIDARADLFAVGVIAHELLTNRPLFSGRDDVDTLRRVRDMHIDPPSKQNPLVPPEIDDIVMTALARDPERRWQHATALRTALTTLTRRLDMIATNAQVIQWLDWAFSHPAAPPKRHDTDAEAEPIIEQPSLSTAQRTPDLASDLASDPRVTASTAMPPMARASSTFPVHAPSAPPTFGLPVARPSSPPPPPMAGYPPHWPSLPPPPIAMPYPPYPPAPGNYPAPQVPAGNPAPFSAPRPARPSQAPIQPRAPGALGVPAALAPSRGPGYDPARSSQVPHDVAQRAASAGPPGRRGPLLTVLLVVLTATLAATTVYLVLPLLT
jgi:serine/threonine protein kinase